MTGDSPIMPREGAAGAPLSVAIAVMAFLGCLALGVVLTIGRVTGDWTHGLAGKLTVVVLPDESRSLDDDLARAAEVLRAAEGVAEATIVPREDAERLVAPWFGEGESAQSLPLPGMIDVTLVPGARPDLNALRAALQTATPGAELDDHARWSERLSAFAGTLISVAWAVLALIALAIAAIVVYATRAGLAAHHEIVEALHLMGAHDGFIAHEFERHFLTTGLRAGFIGLAAAVALLLIAAPLTAGETGEYGVLFLPRFGLALDHYPWLAVVPLAAAGIAMLTARLTVIQVVQARL